MKKSVQNTAFKPMKLQDPPAGMSGYQNKTVVTCTVKGYACDDFEKLVIETGLSKSQLGLQMIYHCLGRTKELENLYKRLAFLAENK